MNLEYGDHVSIIAPASQFRGADRNLLAEAVSLLESWGLHVNVGVDERHHFYLAGPDDVRAAHLNLALADTKTKAIFCTRGGYGSARLLSRLDFSLNPVPKFLVGHSDITSLHLAISGVWPQVVSVHGPNVATRQLLGDSTDCMLNRQSLRDALFVNDRVLTEPAEFLRGGKASGPLVGGCLSLVTAAIGTKFMERPAGAILFLEDTGEPPYRIDRMITHLIHAGIFDQVHGVIFGVMRKCSDPYNDLKSVLSELLDRFSFPIAFGLKSGHGEVNLSVQLGAPTKLDSDAGVVTIG